MDTNPQYDFDWGPDGPLAPLHTRAAHPDLPVMISPPLGWVPLVLKLNEDLAAILPDYTIGQVKEKFASMRYYIDSFGVSRDDPRIALARELIADAEAVSARTCQVCGQPGQNQKDSFYCATVCNEHVRG